MSEMHVERWQSRPVGAIAVRAVVFLVPVLCSIGASFATVRTIPREPGAANLAMRWGIALVVSTIALHLADRAVRRLLPLAVLLRLSLAFPDEAPSRFRLARSAASTRDLARLVERARTARVETEPVLAASEILALASAVESHDRGTRGHSERVRVYTDMIAEQLRLPRRDRDRLRWAALLHDVGKVTVPASILNKPAAPTDDEWAVIERHPDEGARLTASLRPWLGSWATAIDQHHERWDGTGYPNRLAGEDISFAARIVAVADSYETMTARRPYRKPLRAAQARAELVRCSGEQFDPAIVRAFLEISVRRLERVGGPLSWLAQTPLIRGVEQAASSGAAAVGGTALVLGMVPPVTPPAHAPDRPAIVREASPHEGGSPVGAVRRPPRIDRAPDGATPTPEATDAAPSPSPSPSASAPVEPPTEPTTEPKTVAPLPSALPSREP